MFTFFMRGTRDRAATPQERHPAHPQLGASLTRLSLIPPHTKHSWPPLIPPPSHQLLQVAPVWRKIRSWQGGNKARGRGWSAMTVPQHNLFYLTPANASEQTPDHGGAQRTHSAPSFTFGRINDDQKLFFCLSCYFSIPWLNHREVMWYFGIMFSDWVFHRVKYWLNSFFICVPMMIWRVWGLQFKWEPIWTTRMHMLRHTPTLYPQG